MKSFNSPYGVASVMALVLSVIAAPSVMAAETMYPGSNCTYEARGEGNTLLKSTAGIRTLRYYGQIVTCPLPISVPLEFQAGQQTPWVNYRVAVHVMDHTKGEAARCSIQKVSRNGSVSNSDIEFSSGEGNGALSTLVFDRVWFALPLHEWAVLRCHIKQGSHISSYAVGTSTY